MGLVKTSPSRKNSRPGANISAVAERAGVSKAAVSRVLNNGYASPAMRKKVEAAMKALDYSPSAAAMNFASGRTGVIAVVTNNLEGEWVPPVLLGIEKSLTQDKRASLLLGSLTHDGVHDTSLVRSWLEDQRVDGAIFLRPRRSEAKLVDLARQLSIPFALIAPDIPAKGGTELRSDNIKGSTLLGRHLIDSGHKRFAFIGGEKSARDSIERLKGLRAALDGAGLSLPDREIAYGSFSGEDGRDYAKRWLKRKKTSRPTAVVFADDSMALGFVGSLLKAGVRIPDEVSVTGFDNIPATEWMWPGLTTAQQQLSQMGSAACECVLNALAKPQETGHTEKLTFPVDLVLRQTTGNAPRR